MLAGVELRFTKELSPSVPHWREVTEQPIVRLERITSVRILVFVTRGLFVGGCVYDPFISQLGLFCRLFFGRGRMLGSRCAVLAASPV